MRSRVSPACCAVLLGLWVAFTWWRMTHGLVLRVVLRCGVPAEALRKAARDLTAALTDAALTGLLVHRYPLDDIARGT
jgi:hypothetical protein